MYTHLVPAAALDYVANLPLRKSIRAATTEVDAYNGFTEWVRFGGKAIPTGDPVEREKRVKYTDLVASAVMLQNVADLTDALAGLVAEGWTVTPDQVARLSPYGTARVKRFEEHVLDTDGRAGVAAEVERGAGGERLGEAGEDGVRSAAPQAAGSLVMRVPELLGRRMAGGKGPPRRGPAWRPGQTEEWESPNESCGGDCAADPSLRRRPDLVQPLHRLRGQEQRRRGDVLAQVLD